MESRQILVLPGRAMAAALARSPPTIRHVPFGPLLVWERVQMRVFLWTGLVVLQMAAFTRWP